MRSRLNFVCYPKQAVQTLPQERKKKGKMNKILGEDNTCITKVQNWFDKLLGSKELDLQPA